MHFESSVSGIWSWKLKLKYIGNIAHAVNYSLGHKHKWFATDWCMQIHYENYMSAVYEWNIITREENLYKLRPLGNSVDYFDVNVNIGSTVTIGDNPNKFTTFPSPRGWICFSMLVPTSARVYRSNVGMMYLKILSTNIGFD